MVDFHNKTFFGQDSALIVQSSTRKDPATFFKFFQKKQDGAWERPSEGEGLTAKFAMRELVFILRVLSRETEDWTAMHQFQDKTTNFHLRRTSDNTLRFNAQSYTVELDYGQADILRMLLKHILEEKIIHATSSEAPAKEEPPQEPSTLIVKEERVETRQRKKAKKSHPKKRQPSKEKEKKRTEVKGAIERETAKALLINFGGENGQWIPKSTIHSNYSTQKGIEQTFLIDEWVLKKNNVI